jgi:hypothetical protein
MTAYAAADRLRSVNCQTTGKCNVETGAER